MNTRRTERQANSMETLKAIPDPVSLIESTRAVGYSVEVAVADIIDNSREFLRRGNGMCNASRIGTRKPLPTRRRADRFVSSSGISHVEKVLGCPRLMVARIFWTASTLI